MWLAEHKILKVKRIIKGIRKSSELHDRLLNEAHLMKNLKHPYIPEIYDVEEDEEYSYIIEQYIGGKSLKTLCSTGVLSEKEIFHFITQISNIIDYLHNLPEKILYLDIKPENILVSEGCCYLVDFGSARSSCEMEEYSFGSRGFAAPEQYSGGETGHRTDIYALGRLLDYMLDHGNVSPGAERSLRRLAEDCSRKRYWNRTISAAVFTAKLEKLRKKAKIISEKRIKLAFAGAAENVGVTYIALLTGLYMAGQNKACAYVEAGGNGSGPYFTGCEKDRQSIAGLHLVSRKYYEAGRVPDTSLVLDFGRLREEMPEDFYTADLTCIMVGRMVWERKEIAHARALSRKCRSCLFIVNPADSVDEELATMLGRERIMAFPWCSDFDALRKNRTVNERVKELILLSAGEGR